MNTPLQYSLMGIRFQNAIVTVINVVLFIILVVILARPGQKLKEIEVKIATVEDISSLPYWVAYEKGFFEKYGVKFKPNEVSRPSDEYENTLKGALYASFGIDYTYALFKSAGDLRLLRVLYYTKSKGDGLVVRDTGIRFDNLSGLRIGYHENTRYSVILQSLLASRGDTNVEFIGLTSGELESALDDNRVDAIYVVEPLLSYFKNKGYKVIKEKIVFGDIPVILGMGVTSAVNVSLRREAISRIKHALYDAINYIKSHPQEAKSILKKYMGASYGVPEYVIPSEPGDFKKFTNYLIQNNLIPYNSVLLEEILSSK